MMVMADSEILSKLEATFHAFSCVAGAGQAVAKARSRVLCAYVEGQTCVLKTSESKLTLFGCEPLIGALKLLARIHFKIHYEASTIKRSHI